MSQVYYDGVLRVFVRIRVTACGRVALPLSLLLLLSARVLSYVCSTIYMYETVVLLKRVRSFMTKSIGTSMIVLWYCYDSVMVVTCYPYDSVRTRSIGTATCECVVV
jgi:hypothetical protein